MLRAEERSKERSQIRDNESENLGHQGRKRRGDTRNRTHPMQGGVRPQELDQIPPCGKLRCWADCPGAQCEITGAGENAWGQRGTGNRAGVEGKWKGESRDGKPGGVRP